MRGLLSALALVFLASIVPVSADDCRCKGCGCKGGAGWRGPDGACVQKAMLDQTCGNPAGKQSALTEPKGAAAQ